MWIIVIFLLIEKKVCKFKANDENANFPSQFCLESIYDKSEYVESDEVSLKVNVFDFLVDYDAIDKFVVLNIRWYLMVKNNIK